MLGSRAESGLGVDAVDCGTSASADSHAVAACALGLVQRGVRPAQRRTPHPPRPGGRRHPETACDLVRPSAERDGRPGQDAAEHLRDDASGVGGGVRQDEQELLAAVAALDVRAAEHLTKQPSGAREHGISGQVAVLVVDVLEAIEVEHDHRQRRLRPLRAPQLDRSVSIACGRLKHPVRASRMPLLADLADQLDVLRPDGEHARRRLAACAAPCR